MNWLNSSKKTLTLATALLTASLSLTACTSEPEVMSMSEAYPGWDFSQSTPTRKTDTAMSAGFEVGADGKLINPDADKTYEAPTPSDLAQAPDKNGAKAFAQYFIHVVEYTWQTGNTELLRSISGPECAWCAHIADTTDARTQAGGWIQGARIAIIRTEDAMPIPDHPGYWNIFMDLSQDPHTHYTGKEIVEKDLLDTRFQVQVFLDGDTWKVYAAQALGSEE
ncbi:DUF6318 family protein [Schaalia sp. Marseille-Q2122]|uniref:DUF6318 family protein n=1 Tax=Schaalia sp. Marseille-Q2122 TaxID=2736604 RepID=UPI0020CA659F|nr:DUF6318 family protein [Schaalia sp. Marseille-Q2122]